MLELPAQRRRILLDHDVLVVLETDRLERPQHPPRVADPASYLLDAQLARSGRLLLRRLLWPLPRVPDECAWHVTPPPSTSRATGTRGSTDRCRARAQPDRASSGAAAHPSPREPCCAGSSSQGSS